MGAFGARPGSVKYAKNGIPVLVWIYGVFCTELMQIQYTLWALAELWGNCCEHELPTGSVRFMASTKGGSITVFMIKIWL